MTEVRQVDHVQLPIPIGGATKARSFYEQGLGLREVRDPALDRPGTLRFSLGWQRLDLTEGVYIGIAPQAHLALAVSDAAALAARLRRAGFLVDDSLLFERRRVYAEDPFGNRLELLEPKEDGLRLELAGLQLAI
ncbi:MAG TPA: VOC family protein [Burkholderiaceae bacterium]|nr:VOC family protein [Burkholderiaceae bacterium]